MVRRTIWYWIIIPLYLELTFNEREGDKTTKCIQSNKFDIEFFLCGIFAKEIDCTEKLQK